LVQRTTAPEQSRRLVVAELDHDDLSRYGGNVVVENHVNVLRPIDVEQTLFGSEPLLSRKTLVRVLSTPTLDRIMRCLSGSVAVSAYELESLPLPDEELLREWDGLNEVDLYRAVADAYRPVTG
jgi:adenine-specific DNA-methyltransferase